MSRTAGEHISSKGSYIIHHTWYTNDQFKQYNRCHLSYDALQIIGTLFKPSRNTEEKRNGAEDRRVLTRRHRQRRPLFHSPRYYLLLRILLKQELLGVAQPHSCLFLQSKETIISWQAHLRAEDDATTEYWIWNSSAIEIQDFTDLNPVYSFLVLCVLLLF